jgi:putative effector of murein hydrolase LrgA (UPF0299 family)
LSRAEIVTVVASAGVVQTAGASVIHVAVAGMAVVKIVLGARSDRMLHRRPLLRRSRR